MKEKIFVKGIKKILFSLVLALAMAISLTPANSLTVFAENNEALLVTITVDYDDRIINYSAPNIATIEESGTVFYTSVGGGVAGFRIGSVNNQTGSITVKPEPGCTITKVEFVVDQNITTAIDTDAPFTIYGSGWDGPSSDVAKSSLNEDYSDPVATTIKALNITEIRVYGPHTCGSLSYQNGQAANCTSDGWNEYYLCSCGKIYAENNTSGTSYANLDAWKASEVGRIANGHSWGYAANGATLSATCTRDPAHTATLTLSASDANYSGSAVEASYDSTSKTAWEAAGLTAPTITYEAKSGSALTDGKAVNAGSYIVKAAVTVGELTYTATADFTISKANAVITVDKTPITKTFGEAITLPTATTNFGTVACDKVASDLVNVGTYTVTYTVAGTDNYNGATETVSVTIGKLAVSEPTVTGAYTYTGNEQNATISGKESFMTESGDVKGTNAGTYTITYLLDNNYKWAEGSDGVITWEIKAKDITGATVVYDESKEYNGETQTFEVASVTIDDLTATYDVTNNTAKDYLEGGYTLTITGNGNFTGTITKSFAITQKDITGATVEYDESKVYNDETQTFAVTSVTIDNLPATFGVTNNTAKDYNENGYTLTITGNGNFTGSIEKIFAISKAEVTVTIVDKASVYGENLVAFTSEVTNGTLYGDDNLNIVLTKESGTNVGTYAITGTYNNANYNVTFENGTYTIIAKDITLTIVDVATGTYTYDGTEKTTTATYTDLVGNDKLSYVLSYSDNINAGTCEVTIASASITEGTATNYNLITNDTGTLVIDKAPLTITAKNNTITYSQDPANEGVTYEGFVNNETSAVLSGTLTYEYNYTKDNNVGEYTITPSGLTSSNYNITFVNGKLNVTTKSSLTNDAIQTIADQIHTGTAITPSIVVKDGEKTLVKDTDYTVAYSNNTNVGTATATVTFKGNYAGTISKTFVINQKAEEVVIKDETGEPIENPEVSIIGATEGIEPNAVLVVKVVKLVEVAEDTEVSKQALNNENKIGNNEKIYGIYDAKLLVDNVEVQPNGTITIKMLVPTELLHKTFNLFHIHTDKATGNVSVEDIDYTDIDENGYITFTTDKLSQFAFVAENDACFTHWIMLGILIAGAALFALFQVLRKKLFAMITCIVAIVGTILCIIFGGCTVCIVFTIINLLAFLGGFAYTLIQQKDMFKE